MNSLDHLVLMANQIAKNIAIQGEAKAIAMTATHIHSFWDPRMRSMIRDYVAKGGEGLSPIALAAIQSLEQ